MNVSIHIYTWKICSFFHSFVVWSVLSTLINNYSVLQGIVFWSQANIYQNVWPILWIWILESGFTELWCNEAIHTTDFFQKKLFHFSVVTETSTRGFPYFREHTLQCTSCHYVHLRENKTYSWSNSIDNANKILQSLSFCMCK